jgi:hypothetical protein
MCAFGLTDSSLSRLPAGTTSSAPFACLYGNAEPHVEQKHRVCLVGARLNRFTPLSPEIQLSCAVLENRLAACAEPVSFRQRLQ